MRILKQILSGALCALTVLAGGCKEEGRDVLFEESGTWSLFLYNVDGTGLEEFDTSSRVGKFLLHFSMIDDESGVVAAASCRDSMGRTDLTLTLCDVPDFECRCFDYTYEKSVMNWTERPLKGEELAEPKTTTINLSVYEGYKSTFRFKPLPEGLFNSDGTSAEYVFQSRGDALFEPTGCIDACGIVPVGQESGESGGG
jgi:hypothetical protein